MSDTTDTPTNSSLYLDQTQEIETRIDDLLQFLTIEEKASLLKGNDFWTTKPIPRAHIPSFGMTDGPIGVAYHSSFKGIRTRFPGTIGLAATWNRQLSYSMGKAMGKEVRLSGRHQLLGPGINLIRSPLCGRNFEYLSEDPILSSELGIELVKGIQSEKIAACIKHYVTNNSETKRMSISTEISERALQEVYIKNFKRVIEKADPWGLMVCYNKVQGGQGADNKYILRDILRDQLNFTGHVVTDWGAARKTKSTASCIKAGLNLEMPGKLLSNAMPTKKVLKALESGEINEKDLNYVVKPLLRTFFRVGLFDQITPKSLKVIDDPVHQQIAQDIAEESMVLLKNENQILPLSLDKIKKLAILGPNADKSFGKPFQGGSSAAIPTKFTTPYKGIIDYTKDKVEIVAAPEDADVVILVLGLDHGGSMFKNFLFRVEGDSEGADRKRYELPPAQEALLRETVAKNPNTIVVLVAGSPVNITPWYDEVPAILNAWYPGMMGGQAIARTLFGDVNPSGKLPVTYPMKIEDHPAHQSNRTFPGDLKAKKIYYEEGIFIGYRYFDKYSVEPMFPFGFGLSYTAFEFSNVRVDRAAFDGKGEISVSVDVKNTGERAGAEVVQLYVEDVKSTVDKPPRELQGFDKVFLQPKESKTVSIRLDRSSFEYYSEDLHAFTVEDGEYALWCGNSSRNLPLSTSVQVKITP
ncbi:MAG: glycosyl hydrolase [Promethearchaeota archaeon]|nr:MAG: glycosyl hydrolase [Candidatus Lokiarchaeota archaeon]